MLPAPTRKLSGLHGHYLFIEEVSRDGVVVHPHLLVADLGVVVGRHGSRREYHMHLRAAMTG